jgi:hypothetical protein
MKHRGMVSARLRLIWLAAACGLLTGLLAIGAPADAGGCAMEAAVYWGPDNDVAYDTDDGADEDNLWEGQGGRDYLRTRNDRVLVGGNGIDDIGSGSGDDDFVDGGMDADQVRAGQGDDFLHGGAGDDDIFDVETSDLDSASGEGGNDSIDVDDSDGLDVADGGSGTSDICVTDAGDSRSSCES